MPWEAVSTLARILVIEDERDLQRILEYNLRKAGHEVAQAFQGSEGLKEVQKARPDLILLDLMLPDLSGIEVCRTLKADLRTREIPIMMVTAKGEEIDRVIGFELGAEDYIVKPFSVRELLLRIQAVLRRLHVKPSEGAFIEFGHLKMDPEAHRTWVEGREVQLTSLEFRLLMTLLERRNRVQTRAMLLEDVWGLPEERDVRTVDTHVKRLREKLGVAQSYIETVRGTGYRFVDSPEGIHP